MRNNSTATNTWRCLLALMLACIMLGGFAFPSPASAQEATEFDDLDPAEPVIDLTGSSLTADQVADLNAQITTLAGTGAEVVVLVRNLDATPDETLDQVEALQQAWAATSGANQDTTIAVLINRNPNDPHDARAGIYVGRTYNDGNIPEDEQRTIVSDVLIPPLRDGDVFTSFSDTLARVQEDILHGPPRNAFERWSESAAGSWLSWVSAGVAAVGAGVGALLFQRRQTIHQSPLPPTTIRPEPLIPAVAGALVAGSPQPSAFPATVLDLAARGALRIEPESEGGTFSQPKIRVRLLDERRVSAPEEQIVWTALQKKAEVNVVSSKNLPRAASDDSELKGRITATMREHGWLDAQASGPRAWLFVLGLVALALAFGTFIISAAAEEWRGMIGAALLVAMGILAFVFYGNFSGLSQAGQSAALSWKAYRDGLKQAAKDDTLPLDLDEVLADAVAFNLGSNINGRMKTAVENGATFRAFSASTTGGQSFPVFFPWWIAYNSSLSTASGSGSTVVSGGGAGGGGGAAGST